MVIIIVTVINEIIISIVTVKLYIFIIVIVTYWDYDCDYHDCGHVYVHAHDNHDHYDSHDHQQYLHQKIWADSVGLALTGQIRSIIVRSDGSF